MYDLFQHFTRNNWIYETKMIYEFLAQMTEAEREEFYIDPKTFDWQNATHLYAYGTESYMFKEDRVAPDGKSLLLLHKNQFRYFDDVQRVMKDIEIICRDPNRLRKEALDSAIMQDFIQKETKKTGGMTKAQVMTKAGPYIDEIQA